MRVAVSQLEPLESVDRLTARLGGDLLHGRLEALPDVEHEVCVEDLLDFAWGQLEVVRLRSCGREEFVTSTPSPPICSAANARG